MLVFTNRTVLAGHGDESAFTAEFVPESDTLGMAEVTRNGAVDWSLAGVTPAVTDAAAEAALGAGLRRPAGRSSSTSTATAWRQASASSAAHASRSSSTSRWSGSRGPRKAAAVGQAQERRDRRARRGRGSMDARRRSTRSTSTAKSGAIADVIARYRQSKRNGKSSAAALARFLERVGKAQRERTRRSRSRSRRTASAFTACRCCSRPASALACRRRATSPCWRRACRSAKHEQWIPKLPRSDGLMITTNISDWVLLGALWADKRPGQARRLEFRCRRSSSAPKTRYVDFSRRSFGEHEYFIAEQGKALDDRPARRLHALLQLRRRHPRRIEPVPRVSQLLRRRSRWSA